ncbi:polymorphic outer membrane protein middle domain-containing protein [Chlamydia psittaci]|uniref:polymorphic outer membrane protein middle domain-containing protein n=1 Tax=Chlamydia psittaci TaxID=83554 RepID=UPI00027E5E59|nr:polymorphic outer membrane protein middle domain-containing protein [Chlamydia psittaci]AFS27837.1 outer membrane autotransporter barrel domain protein [Chlamydia psittaci NJ1]KPZ38039.1 autotransporter [Chlamydia psittaci NJ1]MDS0919872.1 polymorphic outer membrane protein middle domain-containing protein [Chlamydia psittaci]MDS0990221.1 polymorphic outer membrane protein middle domain-containing protein [Chlamydia psittaci]MDS0996194.1 polymorphic outer membrane protein middle domain-cont
MKSSVPWLLISSAITFPLSSLANEKAVPSSTPQNTGEQTLSSSDNYDGNNPSDTPFTCKNSSFASGTTYTLTSDVSFTNVSTTQAAKSQQSSEAQQNNSEDTGTQGTSSPSTPATTPDSDIKDNKDSTRADPHPGPVPPESSTEDTNGDATSTGEASGTAENTQDTEPSKESDDTKVEEKTETDKEVTEDEKEKATLESSIPHTPLSFTASSDVAGENGVLSPEPKTAPNSTTSQANGDTPLSCFSNTDGSLAFVGDGHSLTFSNISVTAQGSAINNSAGSALTFSGFKDLSFISATNQDQTKADSAIYVGPKAVNSESGPSVDSKQSQANSHTEGSVNTEPLVKYVGISSDVATITGGSQKDSDNHDATATQGGGEKEEVAAPSPDIILKQNVNITFSSNSSKTAGGAICVSGSATIENNTGTCTFSNNNAKEQGGAISVNGNCDITGNKNVVFSGNQAQEIPAPSIVTVEEDVVEPAEVPAKGSGGAIYCLKAPISIPATPILPPTQTLPALESAALLAETHTKIAPEEEPSPDPCLTISGNTSVTFNNNSSTVTGGAIHAKKVVLSSNGNMTFSNNSSGKGGAIYIADDGDISITAATGSIIFQGNKVTAADSITLPTKKETAIAAESIEDKTDSSQASGGISADITSAFFTLANKAKVQDESQAEKNNAPKCNSIHLGSGAKISQLRAQTGQTIFFYDPITTTAPAAAANLKQPNVSVAKATSRIPASASAVSAPAPAVVKTPLKINAPDTPDPAQKVAAETAQQSAVYNGKIVFSGEKLSSEDAQNLLNAISVIHNDVSLEAGTLVLSNGAGLLVDSFTQKEGSLIVMDGGTSIITNVTPASAGLQSRSTRDLKNAIPVVRAVSQRIASSLINFKERSFSETGAVAPTVEESLDGSITINNLAVNLDSLENGKVITLAAKGRTGSVTLTGNLQFQDSNQNFYDNPLLNNNFTLNFLDISAPGEGKVNTEGFNMIPQGATGSDLGYQGKWEVTEIKDPSGKVSFEIKWVSAGYIPTANRRATLVPNSLWCSAIDMRAFQKLVEVSTEGEDFHKGLWISGISNFFHRDSMKEQEGFRHISSGYVVGVSTQPISDKVIDLAFCQMLGKSKDYHLADARSHVYAASVHTKFEKLVNHYKLSNRKGAILARKPEKSPVIFDAQLSYSLSHNSMKTKHTPNPSSRGKWNNHCVAGELGSYLPILVDHPAIEELFPFVKLHIVFVQQEDFKETKGGTENRNFQSAHFINVSLPLGVKFEKTNKLNTYNIRLAYQPDIYRDAPKSKVFLPSVNTAWSTGATNLSRQAMIIDGSDHHHLTDNLEVFCHGAFELRGSSRNYNVDIGGRYKF